jgi:hypothetical protein
MRRDSSTTSWRSTSLTGVTRMANASARTLPFLSTCAVVIVSTVVVSPVNAAADSLKVAYAHVRSDGTLDTANSKNVVAMVHGATGGYCFKLTFRPKNAVATIANDPTAPDQGLGAILVAVPPTLLPGCGSMAKPDSVVTTFKETTVGGGAGAGGHAFYVYWTR